MLFSANLFEERFYLNVLEAVLESTFKSITQYMNIFRKTAHVYNYYYIDVIKEKAKLHTHYSISCYLIKLKWLKPSQEQYLLYHEVANA